MVRFTDVSCPEMTVQPHTASHDFPRVVAIRRACGNKPRSGSRPKPISVICLDMTFAVDWALKNSYLFVFLLLLDSTVTEIALI